MAINTCPVLQQGAGVAQDQEQGHGAAAQEGLVRLLQMCLIVRLEMAEGVG